MPVAIYETPSGSGGGKRGSGDNTQGLKLEMSRTRVRCQESKSRGPRLTPLVSPPTDARRVLRLRLTYFSFAGASQYVPQYSVLCVVLSLSLYPHYFQPPLGQRCEPVVCCPSLTSLPVASLAPNVKDQRGSWRYSEVVLLT